MLEDYKHCVIGLQMQLECLSFSIAAIVDRCDATIFRAPQIGSHSTQPDATRYGGGAILAIGDEVDFPLLCMPVDRHHGAVACRCFDVDVGLDPLRTQRCGKIGGCVHAAAAEASRGGTFGRCATPNFIGDGSDL